MSRSTADHAGRSCSCLLALLPVFGSRYLIDVVTEIMIYALFALSLNVIVGYSGNVSFGHAAYFAIGGYVNAISADDVRLATAAGYPGGLILSTVAAAVVAYFCTQADRHLFRDADAGILDVRLGSGIQMAQRDRRG